MASDGLCESVRICIKFVFCSQWFFCSVQLHPLCRIFDLSCSPVVPTKERINLSVGAASLYLSSALPRTNYHTSELFFGVINDVVYILRNSAIYRPYTPKTTCTYKQSTIVPVQAVKSYRGSEVIVLLALNRCAWWRSDSRYGHFTPERTSVRMR